MEKNTDYNKVSKKEIENHVEANEKKEVKVKKMEVVVGAHKLYVRKNPESKSKRITMASRGDKLGVVQKIPKWFKVRTNDGEEGYVMAEYVKEI